MRDPVSSNYLDTLSRCCCTARLPPGSASTLCIWARHLSVWESCWVQFGVQTLKRIGENSDPCGRPNVGWWGAELQFPSCINTVLSRSAPATYQVSVRLTPYCTSRSISSLNGLEIDCPSHCFFFPLESFVHVICKWSCIFPCALYWSEPSWFAGSISLSSRSLASFLATMRSMSFPAVFCIVRMRYPFSLWWSFPSFGKGPKKLSVQSSGI